MPRPDRPSIVDTRLDRSVSFAPPDPTPLRLLAGRPRTPVAVGPGRSAIVAPSPVRGARTGDVSGYPIRPGKVQQPPLREETLARTRLLDWLSLKIHNRVIFVIAEAGYGKTTLLADFARRTRIRTLWYRMDDEDREWVGFLSHLVAAGREHVADFAPRTAAMLRDTEPGGPTRDDVLEAFLRELPTIVDGGASLILDDFHVAEGSDDVRLITREIIRRAPERFSVVLASRRTPVVPVARIRALGELAELSTDDLRFSPEETEQLFRETYGRHLEPDVLADLNERTEGWAASLSLVQTALRDRTAAETRSFVRQLSGAQGDVRDYLAEEVVGELGEDLHSFLLATALLPDVSVSQAVLAADIDEQRATTLLDQAERLGLLARVTRKQPRTWRYHPLLREFLLDRAEATFGSAGVAAKHDALGRANETEDWLRACYHFAAANNLVALSETLLTASTDILAQGSYDAAQVYLSLLGSDGPAELDVLRSRALLKSGDVIGALRSARTAVQTEGAGTLAQLNLMSLEYMTGNLDRSLDLAQALELTATDALHRSIATGIRLQLRASVDGSIDDLVRHLAHIEIESRRRANHHYEGVTRLNKAWLLRERGDSAGARAEATEALHWLGASSAGWEVPSAHSARAWSLAHDADMPAAREEMRRALHLSTPGNRAEVRLEWADLEIWYGSEALAHAQLEAVDPSSGVGPHVQEQLLLSRLELSSRARKAVSVNRREIRLGLLSASAGTQVRRLVALGLTEEDPTAARERFDEALRLAVRQGSSWRTQHARVLLATLADKDKFNGALEQIGSEDPVYLSVAADQVASRLGDASPTLLAHVREEAGRRHERWRGPLRREVDDAASRARGSAAQILDEIGAQEDIGRLRAVARDKRFRGDASKLGRSLARRLAPRAIIEDLGRLEIRIGDRSVSGGQYRRKVMAMLCLLLTRPGFSATRDEVVDALWPDMDPEVALNSLNQTVYFLRRVFEPDYKEELSPGYVHSTGDVLHLDQELVSSRSAECLALLEEWAGQADQLEHLSRSYTGRFAIDFLYEEWAVPFRESLHGAYVHAVEAEVSRDLAAGEHERGIRIARRAIGIEHSLEQVHLALVRLYRATGAHSAAAEQYAVYSALLRDELGLEAPPLESL